MTLAGLDPTELCVTSDGAIIVTTLTEVSHTQLSYY